MNNDQSTPADDQPPEPTDIFLWANQADAHKDELEIDLFLFTKIMSYNFLSGDALVGLGEGRPLTVRRPEARFSLAGLMRSHLFAQIGRAHV